MLKELIIFIFIYFFNMDTSTLSSLSGTGADGAQPHADIVAAVVAGSGVPGSSDGADALVAAPVTAAGSQNLLRTRP